MVIIRKNNLVKFTNFLILKDFCYNIFILGNMTTNILFISTNIATSPGVSTLPAPMIDVLFPDEHSIPEKNLGVFVKLQS